MVGASGFEPPTSWSRTMKVNSINASSGVAYGTRGVISPLLVVPNLYPGIHRTPFRDNFRVADHPPGMCRAERALLRLARLMRLSGRQ